jgi:translation initiation factor 2 beta subunit (eIF-2beta)/eIF-5
MFQRNLHPFKSDEETDAWVAELQRVLGRMARTNQQLATSLAIPLPSRTDFLKHYERDITKALERSVDWHKSVQLTLARMFVQPVDEFFFFFKSPGCSTRNTCIATSTA